VNKKSPVNAFLIAIVISALVLTSTVDFSKAQTYNDVNGVISTNITLTKANGPYLFSQVVVNSGATLTIEAGTTVEIGNYLRVSGTLIAKGTLTNPIYFNSGISSIESLEFTSTSINSVIENAIFNLVPVSISSTVTMKGSYLTGGQAQISLSIHGGSPIISNNTLKGTLDTDSVIYIDGGSPTISNNNIIAYVDNGLYPNPPQGMNRFGSGYGVHATNVNGAQITNNRFFGPFRVASVQVASGTATVEGNTEYPNDTVAFPSPTPPPPTPTPIPTPTLPPYPPPSQSSTPTPTSTPPTTPLPTINTGPIETKPTFFEIVIAVIIALIIITVILIVLVVLLLRKKAKA
jgi:hypothetical protein